MHRRVFLESCSVIGLVNLSGTKKLLTSCYNNTDNDLATLFSNPEVRYYPQTFWFWMNGHVSKEGITLDLEAMKRAGISGVLNFDAGISIPQGPVKYLSQEWMDLKTHAIAEADRLGLTFSLHNCPGWSASGGPWIVPEMAMKQLTWSEAFAAGGNQLHIRLPVPFHKAAFYRDSAVLAYPSLKGESTLQHYSVSSSSGAVGRRAVTGEEEGGVIVSANGKKEGAWLLFKFHQPQEVRFLTFLISAVSESGSSESGGRTFVWLEASNDGINFRTVATIGTGMEAELAAGDKFITYDIEPTKATYWRLRSNESRRYSQVRFSGIRRLKNFLEKTGNRFMFTGEGYEDVPAGNEQQDILLSSVNGHSVIDLSAHLSKEGVLQWDAPPGNWTILRLGYTITGATNKAAPERGVGLECDKFSREAIDFHFEQMLRHLPPLFLELAIKGKAGFEIDSYEAGPQTWTKAFPDEFHSRRGYAIQNYLPALTGRIINSISYTEQFLWDVRKTQADLMADYYYGRFTELCHSRGLKSFVEPYDKGPFEEMQAGSKADVAMGEFWYGLHSLLQGNLSVQRTSKLAASIMSTNGRMVVGAESFTSEPESSRWQEYPFTLKVLGDKMFCEGINNMIIHRFAHQPNTHVRPGMTMGPWGIHFDRTNTWFQQANGWLQYTARCQAMLQQGLPVRDLLYFTGEEANVYTRVSRKDLVPAPPVEYDYDLINADTILQKLRISNGTIVLSHGMRYKVLVLQDFRGITLKLLQKLQQLVHEGMILIGKKPSRLLGLEAVQKGREFERIVEDLWAPSSDSGLVLREVGKGHVIWGDSLKAILQRFHIEPDVVFSCASGNAPVLFTHRAEAGTDIYFITNQRRSFETIQGSFRVKNKLPEIWDPVTGKMIVASLYQSTIDRTFLPLHLPPYGSLFIVFRSPATSQGLLSVTRHAKQVLSTTPLTPAQNQLFRGIANNFTVVLWAKPEMNIMTRTSVHMGTFKHPYTDYYAVYPSPGEKRYGPGHATCGLAIGRNGVSIWESRTYPVLALVAEVPISGWSHIALVYQDGVPSVFVNGQMIRKGTKSSANVHPGLGEDHIEEGVSSYNGDMGKPEVFSGHLSVQQLQHLASLGPPSLPLPPLVEVANERGKPALLFWQNGTYHAKKRSGRAVRFDIQNISKPVEIKGPWQISFPPLAGAPPAISLDHLVSLHRVENSGVKYFSGTATYKTNFSISADFLQRKLQVFVDLGRVEVVAQVMINGKDLGTFWIRPYRANVTQAIRIGLNNLEIRVTNLWPNRLIGDEQMPDPDTFSLAGSNGFEHLAGDDFGKLVGYPIEQLPDWYVSGKSKPENGRVCFTTWKHYRRNDPLLESGLIGPVRLTAAILRTI